MRWNLPLHWSWRRAVRVADLVTAAGPQLAAQGFNCVLLGRHHQYANYNDIWGYVAPNGKEYALLGATTSCG